MATVFNPFSSETDDQENKTGQQAQAQSGGNNSLSTSGASADIGTSGGAANPKAPTSSGSYTNIQNYLNANKDVAPNLTNQVSGNIQNSAHQAQSGIQKARDAFDQASKAGTLTSANEDTAKQTIDDAGQQVYGDTGAATNTPNQGVIDSFNRVSSGAYKGPNNLANYGDLSNQAQNVRDMGALSNSENGQFTLLRQMFNNPNYTSGQTNLDAALVGANQKQLAPARATAYQLPAFANSNIQGASNMAGQNAQISSQIGADTRNYLNTQSTAQAAANQAALKAAADAEMAHQAQFNTVSQNAANNALTKQSLQNFGIDPNTSLFNLKLNDYIKTNDVAAPTTVAQIIDKQNAAKTNALGILGGSTPTFADLNSVGNFQPSTQTFDLQKFLADQDAAQGKYDSARANYEKLVNARLLLHPQETTGAPAPESGGSWLSNLASAAGNVLNPVSGLSSPVRGLDPNQIQNNVDTVKAGLGAATSSLNPVTQVENTNKALPAVNQQFADIPVQPGGIYNDIAAGQYGDMIQKYGSLDAARAAATQGFTDPQSYDYGYQSEQIQNLIDAMNAMGQGNKIRVLPDPAATS